MKFKPGDLFTIVIIAVLIAAVVAASEWVLRASIIVLALGGIGIVLATAQLLIDVLTRTSATPRQTPKYELPTFDQIDPRVTLWGSLEIWGWLIGLVIVIKIIGLPLAMPLFVLSYAKFYGASWRLSTLLALMIAAFVFGVYQQIMHVYWPESLLGDLLAGDL